MAFARRIYRMAAILLWSAFIGIISIPYQLMGGWDGIKRLRPLVRLWNKGMARILNLKVNITGKVPELSGGLIVSNHLSYIDIIVHGSALPVRYSPKADLAKWPLIGWYVGLSKPVWVNRVSKQASKRTSEEFAQTLGRGMFLIAYPEGTSTDGKHGILPFKSTPFDAAIAGGSPVLPVIIRYHAAPGSPEVCWYGDMEFMPHVWDLLGIAAICAELHFLEPVFPGAMARKELAAFVHDRMAAAYQSRLDNA